MLSGRRKFFYFYDAISGKVDLVPGILGRDERSWERHTVSPDGKLIAFVGNDGYVVLVDSHSKQSIGSLKLNGSVRAITFTPDGSEVLASGSDGDIYRCVLFWQPKYGRLGFTLMFSYSDISLTIFFLVTAIILVGM